MIEIYYELINTQFIDYEKNIRQRGANVLTKWVSPMKKSLQLTALKNPD